MNHTPTPWKVEPKSNYDDGNLRVEGKDRSICRIDLPDAEDEANAQYIVRACNAHEELVAALRLILEGNTMADRENWSHADVIQEHYKIARKALTTIEKGA